MCDEEKAGPGLRWNVQLNDLQANRGKVDCKWPSAQLMGCLYCIQVELHWQYCNSQMSFHIDLELECTDHNKSRAVHVPKRLKKLNDTSKSKQTLLMFCQLLFQTNIINLPFSSTCFTLYQDLQTSFDFNFGVGIKMSHFGLQFCFMDISGCDLIDLLRRSPFSNDNNEQFKQCASKNNSDNKTGVKNIKNTLHNHHGLNNYDGVACFRNVVIKLLQNDYFLSKVEIMILLLHDACLPQNSNT